MTLDHEEHPGSGPIVRDRRRIDPETGEVRQRPDQAAAAPAGAENAETAVEARSDELAERTADLQRLQAEYLNYKRRVERDRETSRKNAVAATLSALLPVLDDIARAREHDELTGGFRAVAESLEKVVDQLGLTRFGEVGEAFDPRIHEALMHSFSDDADGPTCVAVLQVGYRIDDRILRPARVAVSEPPHADSDPKDIDEAGPVVDDTTSNSAYQVDADESQ